MLVNTLEIENKILETLAGDEELKSYIKSIAIGKMGYAMRQFPFIEISNFSYTEGRLLASSGTLIYTIDIYAGMRSLVKNAAFQGAATGEKGVLQICNDIRKVIENNHFSGTFSQKISNITVNPRYMIDDAETICIGLVSFKGEVWFRHG